MTPELTVTAYFDLDATGGDFFTLDDPIKGELDGAYELGGPVATDISQHVFAWDIDRGRTRPLDAMQTGTARVSAWNFERLFDPEYDGGTFFGDLLPGRRVTLSADGEIVFDGNIYDFGFDYSVSGVSTVTFDVADALGALAGREFDEWTTDDGQLPGARLDAVLDRDEVAWPSGSRDLDVGTSTLQADVVSWGSNVLNYAQLVALSDFGAFFASRVGTLTFQGRNFPVSGTGAPLFADDGSGIAYGGLSRARSLDMVYNRVSVDRENGIAQTVSDAASQTTYGIQALSVSGLLLDSDYQSLQAANYLLNLFKDPQPRVSSIDIWVHGLAEADRLTVLALELGDVVQVRFTPNGIGDPIDKFCRVESLRHSRDQSTAYVLTIGLSNLADGFAGTPFTLDSTEFGELDDDILGF